MNRRSFLARRRSKLRDRRGWKVRAEIDRFESQDFWTRHFEEHFGCIPTYEELKWGSRPVTSIEDAVR